MATLARPTRSAVAQLQKAVEDNEQDEGSDDLCTCCQQTGVVVICDKKACKRVYHLTCLKDPPLPEDGFVCPAHFCSICSAPDRTVSARSDQELQVCVGCGSAFCVAHAPDPAVWASVSGGAQGQRRAGGFGGLTGLLGSSSLASVASNSGAAGGSGGASSSSSSATSLANGELPDDLILRVKQEEPLSGAARRRSSPGADVSDDDEANPSSSSSSSSSSGVMGPPAAKRTRFADGVGISGGGNDTPVASEQHGQGSSAAQAGATTGEGGTSVTGKKRSRREAEALLASTGPTISSTTSSSASSSSSSSLAASASGPSTSAAATAVGSSRAGPASAFRCHNCTSGPGVAHVRLARALEKAVIYVLGDKQRHSPPLLMRPVGDVSALGVYLASGHTHASLGISPAQAVAISRAMGVAGAASIGGGVVGSPELISPVPASSVESGVGAPAPTSLLQHHPVPQAASAGMGKTGASSRSSLGGGGGNGGGANGGNSALRRKLQEFASGTTPLRAAAALATGMELALLPETPACLNDVLLCIRALKYSSVAELEGDLQALLTTASRVVGSHEITTHLSSPNLLVAEDMDKATSRLKAKEDEERKAGQASTTRKGRGGSSSSSSSSHASSNEDDDGDKPPTLFRQRASLSGSGGIGTARHREETEKDEFGEWGTCGQEKPHDIYLHSLNTLVTMIRVQLNNPGTRFRKEIQEAERLCGAAARDIVILSSSASSSSSSSSSSSAVKAHASLFSALPVPNASFMESDAASGFRPPSSSSSSSMSSLAVASTLASSSASAPASVMSSPAKRPLRSSTTAASSAANTPGKSGAGAAAAAGELGKHRKQSPLKLIPSPQQQPLPQQQQQQAVGDASSANSAVVASPAMVSPAMGSLSIAPSAPSRAIQGPYLGTSSAVRTVNAFYAHYYRGQLMEAIQRMEASALNTGNTTTSGGQGEAPYGSYIFELLPLLGFGATGGDACKEALTSLNALRYRCLRPEMSASHRLYVPPPPSASSASPADEASAIAAVADDPQRLAALLSSSIEEDRYGLMPLSTVVKKLRAFPVGRRAGATELLKGVTDRAVADAQRKVVLKGFGPTSSRWAMLELTDADMEAAAAITEGASGTGSANSNKEGAVGDAAASREGGGDDGLSSPTASSATRTASAASTGAAGKGAASIAGKKEKKKEGQPTPGRREEEVEITPQEEVRRAGHLLSATAKMLASIGIPLPPTFLSVRQQLAAAESGVVRRPPIVPPAALGPDGAQAKRAPLSPMLPMTAKRRSVIFPPAEGPRGGYAGEEEEEIMKIDPESSSAGPKDDDADVYPPLTIPSVPIPASAIKKQQASHHFFSSSAAAAAASFASVSTTLNFSSAAPASKPSSPTNLGAAGAGDSAAGADDDTSSPRQPSSAPSSSPPAHIGALERSYSVTGATGSSNWCRSFERPLWRWAQQAVPPLLSGAKLVPPEFKEACRVLLEEADKDEERRKNRLSGPPTSASAVPVKTASGASKDKEKGGAGKDDKKPAKPAAPAVSSAGSLLHTMSQSPLLATERAKLTAAGGAAAAPAGTASSSPDDGKSSATGVGGIAGGAAAAAAKGKKPSTTSSSTAAAASTAAAVAAAVASSPAIAEATVAAQQMGATIAQLRSTIAELTDAAQRTQVTLPSPHGASAAGGAAGEAEPGAQQPARAAPDFMLGDSVQLLRSLLDELGVPATPSAAASSSSSLSSKSSVTAALETALTRLNEHAASSSFSSASASSSSSAAFTQDQARRLMSLLVSGLLSSNNVRSEVALAMQPIAAKADLTAQALGAIAPLFDAVLSQQRYFAGQCMAAVQHAVQAAATAAQTAAAATAAVAAANSASGGFAGSGTGTGSGGAGGGFSSSAGAGAGKMANAATNAASAASAAAAAASAAAAWAVELAPPTAVSEDNKLWMYKSFSALAATAPGSSGGLPPPPALSLPFPPGSFGGAFLQPFGSSAAPSPVAFASAMGAQMPGLMTSPSFASSADQAQASPHHQMHQQAPSPPLSLGAAIPPAASTFMQPFATSDAAEASAVPPSFLLPGGSAAPYPAPPAAASGAADTAPRRERYLAMDRGEREAAAVLSQFAPMDVDGGPNAVNTVADLLPPSATTVNEAFFSLSANLRRALIAQADLRAAWAASRRSLFATSFEASAQQGPRSGRTRAVVTLGGGGIVVEKGERQGELPGGQATLLVPDATSSSSSSSGVASTWVLGKGETEGTTDAGEDDAAPTMEIDGYGMKPVSSSSSSGATAMQEDDDAEEEERGDEEGPQAFTLGDGRLLLELDAQVRAQATELETLRGLLRGRDQAHGQLDDREAMRTQLLGSLGRSMAQGKY